MTIAPLPLEAEEACPGASLGVLLVGHTLVTLTLPLDFKLQSLEALISN